jgi:hypothetical protein
MKGERVAAKDGKISAQWKGPNAPTMAIEGNGDIVTAIGRALLRQGVPYSSCQG